MPDKLKEPLQQQLIHMPKQLETEAALLSSIFADPKEYLPQVTPILQPDDFSGELHAAVYRAMMDLEGQGLEITLAEVAKQLAGRYTIQEIAGAVGEFPDTTHVRANAATLKELSDQRKLITTLQRSLHNFQSGGPVSTISELSILKGTISELESAAAARGRVPVEELPLAVPLGAFLNAVPPRRDYIMGPWFLEKNSAMVYGPTGEGKTWITTGICAAVGSGGTFLRWTAPRPRRVLFVDGELSYEELHDRFMALIPSIHLSADQGRELSVNLRIMTPDVLRSHNVDTPNIMDPKGQELIEKFLDGAELLVLDNISTLARGGEENVAESWQAVQDWIVSLRGRGVNVLFAHHANVAGGQRGTSKRMDVLDYVVNVKAPQGKDREGGARFVISFQKHRGKPNDPQAFTPFEAAFETDERGKPTWTIVDLAEDQYRQIVDLYRDGIKNPKEIAELLQIHRTTAWRVIKKAQKNGDL